MSAVGHLGTTLVEEKDTVIYLDEIDITTSMPVQEVPVNNDKFAKINVRKLGTKTVTKEYNKLKKVYQGDDGTKAKFIDPESVYGYLLYDVIVPPYDLDTLASLYNECSILRAVIDSRVMNTVGLGIDWCTTAKSRKLIQKAVGDAVKGDKVRSKLQNEQDRLNDLLDSFNEEQSFMETMIRIWLDVLTTGNGYMEIGRTNGGKVGYIGHVPSTTVRVRRLRDGFVQHVLNIGTFFKQFGTDTEDPLFGDPNPNEMIHFKMYSPTSTYYGVPPSVSALSAIIGDKFAKEYNIDYFENKAIPRYAIILKGVKLSEKSKRELINYFRNEVKGKNHGTLVVPLPATIGPNGADIKFEKLEADIQDSSFDQYRAANRDEIISAYRLPPTKVGVYTNANLAISRDADKTFKAQVLGPDQTLVEKKLNKIIKTFSDLYEISLEQLDINDDETMSRIYDRYARIGAMFPNEIREAAKIGPAYDGGDSPLPYPVKGGIQNDKPWPNEQAMSMKPAPTPVVHTGVPGAPAGNQNSNSPAKSGQDNGKTKTNANTSGTNAERGQAQDQKGTVNT